MRFRNVITVGIVTMSVGLAATSAPALASPGSQPAALGVALSAEGSGDGAHVERVMPGLTGAHIGIQQGDIITRVNGTSVSDADAVLAIMQNLKAGAPIAVTVQRAGREVQLTGVAQARPEGMRVGMHEAPSE